MIPPDFRKTIKHWSSFNWDLLKSTNLYRGNMSEDRPTTQTYTTDTGIVLSMYINQSGILQSTHQHNKPSRC